MALKLRPTGLGAGIDKDRQDFTIYVAEWAMGRIHQQRGGPAAATLIGRASVSQIIGLLALRALAPEVYETAARAPVAPVVRETAGGRESPSEGDDAQRKLDLRCSCNA